MDVDAKTKKFTKHVIFDGRLGVHDVCIGDIDGDGDIGICSKIWHRWTDNANGGLECRASSDPSANPRESPLEADWGWT